MTPAAQRTQRASPPFLSALGVWFAMRKLAGGSRSRRTPEPIRPSDFFPSGVCASLRGASGVAPVSRPAVMAASTLPVIEVASRVRAWSPAGQPVWRPALHQVCSGSAVKAVLQIIIPPWRTLPIERNLDASRSLTACCCTSSVPHPFAFFLAKGWETANPKVRNHAVRDLESRTMRIVRNITVAVEPESCRARLKNEIPPCTPVMPLNPIFFSNLRDKTRCPYKISITVFLL